MLRALFRRLPWVSDYREYLSATRMWHRLPCRCPLHRPPWPHQRYDIRRFSAITPAGRAGGVSSATWASRMASLERYYRKVPPSLLSWLLGDHVPLYATSTSASPSQTTLNFEPGCCRRGDDYPALTRIWDNEEDDIYNVDVPRAAGALASRLARLRSWWRMRAGSL